MPQTGVVLTFIPLKLAQKKIYYLMGINWERCNYLLPPNKNLLVLFQSFLFLQLLSTTSTNLKGAKIIAFILWKEVLEELEQGLIRYVTNLLRLLWMGTSLWGDLGNWFVLKWVTDGDKRRLEGISKIEEDFNTLCYKRDKDC